ncbi:MAG: VWA domain-containing protein [Elusimicrobiota bacterium]|jgi:Ca-activated chloride channel family protein
MRFANPFWLLLLPVALAAAAWAFREEDRSSAAILHPKESLLKQLCSPQAGRWVRILPRLMQVCAIVLAVLALARPQKVQRQDASLVSGVDILLVLDTSLSMRALDFDPLDRMSAAKNAARDFIGKRTSDRIGILAFAGVPLLACPLTLDYGALLEYLDDVQAGMTQSDGTAIGDALAAAVSHIKDAPAKSKLLILITDGANNTGVVDPLTAAKTAQACGIKVYTIGTGRRGPAMIDVDDPNFGHYRVQIPDELDEELLAKIADETGGRTYRAQNLRELENIYKDIDRLERSQKRLPPIISFQDLHVLLLLPALILWALGLILPRTILMRLP